MNKLVPILVIGALGWFGYQKYQRSTLASQPVESQETEPADDESESQESDSARPSARTDGYRCDGRQHCSQMRSCEEATWFLEHCPGMKMDGDNDGDPCERGPC